MKLTSEQMQTIVVDEMVGRDPRVKGKAADEFRKDLQPDIKLAKKNGWTIDIPPEWEVNID